MIEAGGIVVDKAAHIVKIDGAPVELSYKEFELLVLLYGESGDRAFERKDSE